MRGLFLLPILVSNGNLAYPALQARTNPCPYVGVAAPSVETRPIRNQNPNFSFQIPQNYRTIKNAYSDGNGLIHYILIVDEASYAFDRCVDRVGAANIPGLYEEYGMDGDWYPTIAVKYRAGNFQNTRDLIKAVFIDMEGAEPVEPLGWTTVLGQQALIYAPPSASHTIDISFIAPNRKYLITVSATAKIRVEKANEIDENGVSYTVDRAIVEGIQNSRVFQNIINSFTFAEVSNDSKTTNIEEIVKVKDFLKKQESGNPYPYYVQSFFSSGQPYPLYIVSEQFPNSRGSINCYRGNGERRMCPSFAYIPSGATYKEVWSTALDLNSIVRLAPERSNNMPCIETVEGRVKTIYCYDGNQYKPLAPTGR